MLICIMCECGVVLSWGNNLSTNILAATNTCTGLTCKLVAVFVLLALWQSMFHFKLKQNEASGF